MTINWPLIIVLFSLSVPGVCIAMSRLINFLLPHNTEQLRKRVSRFAVLQLLFMVFVMSFAGSVLSSKTGLNAGLLEGLLQGNLGLSSFLPILIPTILYAFLGLIVFCVFYYAVVASFLDERSFQIMEQMRAVIGLDGCVLYGGVAEEVIARWGLLNVVAFFAVLFAKQMNTGVMICSLFISGLLYVMGQLPAYIAAGCVPSRRFIYFFLLLSLSQSLLFGFLFWQYGLVSAILAHMLFHIGWGFYAKNM